MSVILYGDSTESGRHFPNVAPRYSFSGQSLTRDELIARIAERYPISGDVEVELIDATAMADTCDHYVVGNITLLWDTPPETTMDRVNFGEYIKSIPIDGHRRRHLG